MAVPTISWDESNPAGSQSIKLGDNRIREAKQQIREVINVDHDFPSSGNASDVGQHKQVTLQEQADLGTGAVNATILGSQTVSGKGELVYTDEDDNDVQLTTGGKLSFGSISAVANMSVLMEFIYPVGSIYANYSNSTNPGTLLGVGTWVAIEEEVIAGYKSGSAEFGSIGSYAGGEKTHTLIESEMPAHTHSHATGSGSNAASTNISTNANNSATRTTADSTGGDGAHNNIQPTYVAYLWRRTV